MTVIAALLGLIAGILISLILLNKNSTNKESPQPKKKRSIFTPKTSAYVVTRSDEELWREEQARKKPLPKNVQ